MEDPFGSDVWKELDQLPLNKVRFPATTRIDLALSDTIGGQLPIYLFINRVTNLYLDELYLPSDQNALSEVLIKLRGSV
jgi:hypothetical protein